MRRFLIGFLAVIGGLGILAAGGVAIAVFKLTSKPGLPGNIILTVDLRQGLLEGPSANSLQQLLIKPKPTLRDFLDGLIRGERDPRVKGLVAEINGEGLGLADTQQIRDAVEAFRKHGKFAFAFAHSLGGFGPGTRGYYLATAFDQIWLQPMGGVGLTGLDSEIPFFKGTLDLLGITPSFSKRERFKTAINSLTKTGMTAAQQEETQGLVTSSAAQIVEGIAKGRELDPQTVLNDIDDGPFLGRDALKAKLIDHLGYRDQVFAQARKRAGAGAKAVRLATYLSRAGRPFRGGTEIALIYGNGLIASDASGSPIPGSTVLAADKVARAFRRAVRDKNVKAILFRIDSPGGSVVASETIWHAVVHARAKGKPVIAWMGDLAGSGGYYIAAPATKIVAEPATLTGSIGVFAGKLVLSGLMKKLGVTVGSVPFGANAAMFSSASDFSPAAHQKLEALLDATYRGFKKRVAEGRHLNLEAVEQIAKGRVWTGEQAKKRGLVDTLGGYRTALGLVRKAVKIPPNAPLKIVVFPKQKSLVELVYERLTGHSDDENAGVSGTLAALSARLPILRELLLGLQPPGVLTMPLFVAAGEDLR